MEIDFDLDNYNLQDILNLFSLNHNFSIDDFKSSKKRVMQLHPDKSGLDKKYFLFYCKALRIIKNIYDFKNKRENKPDKNIEYLAGNDEDKGKQLLVDNLLKKDKSYFHKWFNETFEKINIVDEDKRTGYGQWLQSNEDIEITENITRNKLHEKILEKKETLSSLIIVNNIEATNCYSSRDHQNISGIIPDSYSSSIFSKLPYEDLKKAHTETVVPVSENDYNKVLKFNNANQLQQHRNQQDIKPMTETQCQDYLNNINNNTEETGLQMAYRLARQDEEMEKANKSWWNSLTLLK
jgi:hypothetical protein